MSKLIRGMTALAVCGILSVGFAADELGDEDLLQGNWIATDIVSNGFRQAQNLKDLRVTFSQRKFTMLPYRDKEGKPLEFEFKLDASAKPKAIDLIRPDDTRPMQGLYRLEGDVLTLCLPPRNDTPRPGELASPENSGLSLLTLKRVVSPRFGGIIHELPADGSWVQFAIVGESVDAGGRTVPAIAGTLTIRSVGRETLDDGKPARWIEIESAIGKNPDGPADGKGAIKLLIPESLVFGTDDLRQHVRKARMKDANGVRELDLKGGDAVQMASLDEFFHAPLLEVVKTERLKLETPAGKFVCRYAEARQPALPGDNAEITTRTWSTSGVPFGVARYRHTKLRGSGGRALELTAIKFGTDAKSAIPD